jgi:hypothetical protein
MLIKLINRQFANQKISVNRSTYVVDGQGEVVVDPDDAKVLVECGGYKKVAEVEPDQYIRLPASADEFLVTCRRLNLDGADLRQMADFLDSHGQLDTLPAEGDLPPELPPDEPAPDPEPSLQLADGETDEDLDPLEPIGETEGKSKKDLLNMAIALGLPVERKWSRSKIADAIQEHTRSAP